MPCVLGVVAPGCTVVNNTVPCASPAQLLRPPLPQGPEAHHRRHCLWGGGRVPLGPRQSASGAEALSRLSASGGVERAVPRRHARIKPFAPFFTSFPVAERPHLPTPGLSDSLAALQPPCGAALSHVQRGACTPLTFHADWKVVRRLLLSARPLLSPIAECVAFERLWCWSRLAARRRPRGGGGCTKWAAVTVRLLL